MNKIRLTKEFSFEMAHALKGYDGACLHTHGHSYKFFVTLIGKPISDCSDPKLGMVVDFKTIKQIVGENIINKYDHAIVLNSNDPRCQIYNNADEKLIIVDFQPTCENLIIEFAKIISSKLTGGVKLHHLKLHETASSFAEWYAEDNE